MEAKELLDFLGVEADSLDTFKEKFQGKYFTEKQVHSDKTLLSKFTGKTVQKMKQNILNKFREQDVPFTQSEFDDMELEEVVMTMDARKQEKMDGVMNELKGQVGKSGEEAIKPWQEKVSKLELSLSDEKKAKTEIFNQLEENKKSFEGKIKDTRIQYFKKDLLTSLEYDSEAIKDPLKKKGWEAHVESNFKFDFDEEDKPIILDKTGSKIKNPKKADEWLSPKEVLQSEADTLGLTKKNQQGGQRAFTQQSPGVTTPQTGFTPNRVNQQADNLPSPRTNKLAPGMEQYLSK